MTIEVYPCPPLPLDKSNLLKLYGLRCTGMREAHVTPRDKTPDWIVYARRAGGFPPVGDLHLMLSNSLESWIEAISGYATVGHPPHNLQQGSQQADMFNSNVSCNGQGSLSGAAPAPGPAFAVVCANEAAVLDYRKALDARLDNANIAVPPSFIAKSPHAR